MLTIKDIAREAHVSCGTVSNVINKKGNVSTDKIQLIEETIKRLGYSVNKSARSLRSKSNKTAFLIVPDMRSQHYIDFYDSIGKRIKNLDYSIEIYDTHNLFRREEELIQRAVSEKVSCVISFPTYINSEIYNTVPDSINLIIVGPPPKDILRPFMTVSFNYEKIASNITSYIICKKYKNVALFVDSVRFSKEFVSTLLQNLRKKGISVATYGSTPHNAIIKAFEFCSPEKRIDAIVTSNTMRANSVQLIYTYLSTPADIPEIITLSSENGLFANRFTTVFLDYKKLGGLLGERIISQSANTSMDTSPIIMESDSLRKGHYSIPQGSSPYILNICAPNNPCLHALKKILPQFEHKSGITVKINYYNTAQTESLSSNIINDDTDIFIANINSLRISDSHPFYPKENTGSLLNEIGDIIKKGTFFPGVYEKYCCSSFNVSGYMLFYRTDLFHRHDYIRDFYEQRNFELKVPRSIMDYDIIFRHYTRKLNPFSNTDYGAAMSSLYTDSSLYEIALYILSFLKYSRKPLNKINYCSLDILNALTMYTYHLKYSNAYSVKQLKSADDEYLNGHCMMSFLSTANAYMFNENSNYSIFDRTKTKISEMSIPLVNYDVIGIHKNCTNLENAIIFLKWLLQDSTSNIITYISGQPIKTGSINNSKILSLYPWFENFNKLIGTGVLLTDVFPPHLFNTNFKNQLFDCLSASIYNNENLYQLLEKLQKSINNNG